MASASASDALDDRIRRASDALLSQQQADGHWVYELEADATMPALYVLVRHILGEDLDAPLEAKIAVYLRRTQEAHDGWSLLYRGQFDLSASVAAYLALKVIGDPQQADHMQRARKAILAHGGADKCNVFTRFLFASIRLAAVAGGADPAGRDHAAAAMVSVPSLQGFVLVTRPDHAAHGAAGAQAKAARP